MPQALIGKINEIPGVGRIEVGKIEIMRNRASLEADSRYTPQILAAFQKAMINGKSVSIEIDKGKSSPKRPKSNVVRSFKGRKIRSAEKN